MDPIRIYKEKRQIDANEFDLEESRFNKGSLRNSHFENIMISDSIIFDVNASNLKIVNANLSDMEIEGAQLGGAYIHNVGMPPKGHPLYVEGAKMRPVKFDDCNLSNSTFQNCNLSNVQIGDCNLSGVAIEDCNLTGMTINGIPVQDLLARYQTSPPANAASIPSIITKAYAGFNERNIDKVFSVMHPNIHWPKAFEGGYVIGYDAVRAYWTKQWTEINPIVKPLSVTERPDGKVEVTVDQLVRGLDGSILFDGKVRHIYVIENDLLVNMDIE